MSSIPGFSAELYEVCCERAIAEVRAGRPVVVVATASALVLGVEGLDNAVCARLDSIAGGQGRLILPAARLHQTDLDRRQAGAIALPVIDAARIRRLVLGINIRADEPVGQTLPLEEDALELMRRALVLPAALVLPVEADQIDPWVLRVASADIGRLHSAKVKIGIVSRAPVPLEGALESEFVVFRGGGGLRDQVAIVVGSPDPMAPVPVRLYPAFLMGDLFNSLKSAGNLRQAVREMAERKGGILLYLDQEGRGNNVATELRAEKLRAQSHDSYDANKTLDLDLERRRFEFAAEMLTQLGVKHVRIDSDNPAACCATSHLAFFADAVLGGNFRAHGGAPKSMRASESSADGGRSSHSDST